MLREIESVLSHAMLIVTVAGLTYTAFALAGIRKFARRATPAARTFPPITILKPICGLEVELYENLCSFGSQEYPAYQIIFCFHDADDPAIPLVRRVLDRYPDRDFALVAGESRSGENPKIANLTTALPLAKHDFLVIADADVRVERDYLRAIAAAFEDERVGAATCLYGGAARGGVLSSLGALHINDHFAPSVLAATALQRLRFCLGATMAVRRSVLDEIGGLAALADHLGDDYMLGALVARRGYEVVLVPHVVRSLVFEPGLGALFAHHLRWARTIRTQRPLGYVLLFITYSLPLAALYLVLERGSVLALALFLVAVALRVALHAAAHSAFAPRERGAAWLIPFCDVLELLVWLTGCFGKTVRWRDRRFPLSTGTYASGM